VKQLLILVFAGISISLSAQLVMSTYSSTMVNVNFIIENHSQKDRHLQECIYLIQFDTLMPRLELHFSNKRDLDYFNNYLLCFVSECHRDRQPLLLPGFPKLIYRKEVRGYTLEQNTTCLFKRQRFLQFAKAIRRNAKKNEYQVQTGWQRLKVRF
jgi:hypothetical protein